MPKFVVSSAFADSISRGLQRTPHFQTIVSRLSPAAAALLTTPFGSPWHAGELYVECGEVALGLVGADIISDIGYEALKERFGSIVRPMVEKKLAQPNVKPDVVLQNLEDFVNVAMRGLSIELKRRRATGAEVQVEYPLAVGEHLLASWRGVFRYIFEVTSPGQVTSAALAEAGRLLVFELDWS
jgi:hypothetical protein